MPGRNSEPDRNVVAVACPAEPGALVHGLGSSWPGSGDGGSKLTSTCWKPLLRWALAWREYARRSPVVRVTLSVKGVSSDLGCRRLTRTTLISTQSRTAVAVM